MKGLTSVVVLLLAFCARAQQTDTLAIPSTATALREVKITAFQRQDSLLNAPASIGVLTANDLMRNNGTDINIAINTIPGVQMQSSNIATNRISIRGIGARTPYGTNKIRAFYGGIPLTTGDGETTIEDLDVSAIGQIEIIKGPFSSLYGAGLGGAILLKPIRPKRGERLDLHTTFGSFALLKNTVAFASNTQKYDWNISYHHLQTDGWRDNSGYKRDGVTVSGELFKHKKGQLRYLGNYTALKAYIPSSIDLQTYFSNPTAAAKTWADAKGYKQYVLAMGGLAYEHSITTHFSNTTSVFISYKDNYEPRPFDILGQYTTAYGGRTQFSGDFTFAKIRSEYHFGIEYFRDAYAGRNLENRYQNNNGNGSLQGDLIAAAHQDRSFYNAFAQLRLLFSSKWELQTGVNSNHTQFTLENRWPQEQSETYHYSGIWSPQVALLFKPDGVKMIYFSVSRGFSLPAIAETLTPEGSINPEIKPERGISYELGGKLYAFGKKGYAEITAFAMDVSDLLVAARVGDDQYVGRNAGKTTHRGVEAGLRYTATINTCTLSPFAAFSLGRFRFADFSDRGIAYSGNALAAVPNTQFNAGFEVAHRLGWYLSADVQFTDAMPLNDSNTEFSEAYWIANSKAGRKWQLLEGLVANVAFGINNLANARYAGLVLPNATAFAGAAPRFYYPGLRVNCYLTADLAYRF